MSAINWIIILFNAALAVDAARRPASAWAAADRRKGFWVPMLALFGVIMVIPYVIGVLPRLINPGRLSNSSSFEKRPASPFEKR